jgi:hypothetical protein
MKIQLGLGFCQNFRWEMGLGPPPPLQDPLHCYEVLNLFLKLIENRQCSFRETEFQPLRLHFTF